MKEPHAPIVADHGFDPSLILAHIFVGNGLHLQTTMSKEAMTKHQTKGTRTKGIGDHAMEKDHAVPI